MEHQPAHRRLWNAKYWACAIALMASVPAQSAPFSVSITVDNSYALFSGTLSAATGFVGSDPDWPSVDTYNFDLPTNAYLYVVTASDQSVAQGFLGQFTNPTTGTRFYSSDPAWQVMATGLGGRSAPYSGSAADLALLTQEIQDANAGGNPSLGWVGLTAGGSNGSSPWGFLSGIDAAAKWTWYAGGNCNKFNPTQGGCDAGEWLVFRIAVAATPENPIPDQNGSAGTVPLPGSIGLLGLGVLAAFSLQSVRRRLAAS